MTMLQVLDSVLQHVGDPNAVIRLERDNNLSADHCRIVVVTADLLVAGIAEPTDWDNPENLVAAIVDHVAQEHSKQFSG
jgi:hypothetical protein